MEQQPKPGFTISEIHRLLEISQKLGGSGDPTDKDVATPRKLVLKIRELESVGGRMDGRDLDFIRWCEEKLS
jgi:hypothetical protein